MRSPDGLKHCPCCKNTLPFTDFYEKKYKDGTRHLSGYCRSCTREKSKEWVAKNYERAKARWANDWKQLPRALMTEEQREKVRSSANKYVQNHREAVNEKSKAYKTRNRSADPETFRAKTAIYNNRTRARKKGVPTDFTVADWGNLLISFDLKCAWCGTRATRFDLDHIMPLHLGGYDTVGNIVPICRPCNAEKNSSDPEVFAKTMRADLSEIYRLAAVREPILSPDVIQADLDEIRPVS